MPNLFLRMLEHLRHYEEVMLFGNILAVSEAEQEEVIQYLLKEYKNESITYPFIAPEFDPKAALWGAKIVYVAAQLMLYRENGEADLEDLLPAFEHSITSASILSADLSLRFLVPVIDHLKMIDPDDRLIFILESHLSGWHYSAINYPLKFEHLKFDSILSSKSLYQLYIDRIIEYKNVSLANTPIFKAGVSASLGMYAKEFWSNYKPEMIIENDRN